MSNEKLSRTVGNAQLKLKEASPVILMVAGAIGVVASAVIACRATLKVEDIVEDKKDDINEIHENHATKDSDEYPEKEYKKDLTKCYISTGIELTKLYAPAVILGALSLTAMFASNHKYKERNIELAAAYATLDSIFKRYRGNVIEDLGEDADRKYRFGTVKEKVEETIVDENGKTKKVKKEVEVVKKNDISEYSEYARFFDSQNPNYEECYDEDGNVIYSESEYNLHFLTLQQCHANDLLKSRGYLFLNDVYDMLGFPRTKAGNIVGWVYDLKTPNGDNYVDFGIHEMRNVNMAFVNGYEPVILLDFNVDGPIIDFLK